MESNSLGLSPESQEPDRITIGFYGAEASFPASIAHIGPEVENISIILKKFSHCARLAGRQPPEIIISVFLIPDWENSSDFNNRDYLIKKQQYFDIFSNALSEKIKLDENEHVFIEDFFEKGRLDVAERSYLEGLVVKGSNADMIKTHAIIREENTKRRHLQMDSNTKIFDFQLLYNETFGRADQKDALNASYYDRDNQYVSAHNKIVYTAIYTAPGSHISKQLKETHLAYCYQHADDHKKDETKPEKTQKNSIYSKDFVVALSAVGLTTPKVIHPVPGGPSKTVYLATIGNTEAYRITRCIATAVNMSWSANENDKAPELKAIETELKNLPKVLIRDALCDYTCFANAFLKRTDFLDNHASPGEEAKAHHELVQLSSPLEKEMIKQFLDQVKEKKPEMLGKVMNTMQLDLKRAVDLFREIFGCSPEEYKTSSISPTLHSPRAH